MENNCKYVYVIISQTNTFLGKMIRLFTFNNFNHTSLALNEELNDMYSFARYNLYSPLAGGFVTEKPGRYISPNQGTLIKVFKIPVSAQSYAEIENDIHFFARNQNKMIYNTIGAMLLLFHKEVHIKNTYTCVEFVASILDIKGVTTLKELESKLNDYLIFNGDFKDMIKYDSMLAEDNYFNKKNIGIVLLETLLHFKKLILRLR